MRENFYVEGAGALEWAALGGQEGPLSGDTETPPENTLLCHPLRAKPSRAEPIPALPDRAEPSRTETNPAEFTRVRPRLLLPLVGFPASVARRPLLSGRPGGPWRSDGGTCAGCASPRPSCASSTPCRGVPTASRSPCRTCGRAPAACGCCRHRSPR